MIERARHYDAPIKSRVAAEASPRQQLHHRHQRCMRRKRRATATAHIQDSQHQRCRAWTPHTPPFVLLHPPTKHTLSDCALSQPAAPPLHPCMIPAPTSSRLPIFAPGPAARSFAALAAIAPPQFFHVSRPLRPVVLPLSGCASDWAAWAAPNHICTADADACKTIPGSCTQ